eukprot:sb/3473800/
MFESDDSDDEDDTINKNYAAERSAELKRILTDLSCQFATSACIKLKQAPKLILKPVPTNGDTTVDPKCIVLAPNKGKLDAEIQKREDEEKSRSGNHRKAYHLVKREAVLAEQMDRLAPLRDVMSRATINQGRKVSSTTFIFPLPIC